MRLYINIKQLWQNAYNTRQKRFKLLSGTIIISVILASLPYFFRHIENRNGVILNDWVLDHLPAHDMSIPIFAIIWGMGILMLWQGLNSPKICVTYIWTLIFVYIARFISISYVKLDPPVGFIPITDPLTGVFYGHALITKDLFFSGHTSTMVLICLHLEKRNEKTLAIITTIAIMVMLLIQHIHYTIDVLAAPVIVYGLYSITKALGFK